MTPPGRPRDPQIQERVMTTTLQLLADKGYANVRIDEIVKLSGVAKTTIYRRWPSLPHLVVETIASTIGERMMPQSDDPVSDLRLACAMLVSSVNAGRDSWLAVAMDLHRQQDETLRAYYRNRIVEPARQLLVTALQRVSAAGELHCAVPCPDLADLLIGGVIYRLVMLHEPITQEQIDTIINGLLTPEPGASSLTPQN